MPFGAFVFICSVASIVLRFAPKLRRRASRPCFLATAVWSKRAQYRSPSACRRWSRGFVLFMGDLSDAGLALLMLLAAEWAATFWITFYYHNHSEYTIKTALYSVIIASGLCEPVLFVALCAPRSVLLSDTVRVHLSWFRFAVLCYWLYATLYQL